MKLILASASPRRRELLSRMDIPFETVPADIVETTLPNEEPSATALRLSEGKADVIAKIYPKDLVLGADTIVVLNRKMMGKPKDATDAGRMLLELSGQTHQVLTAVTLVCHERSHRSSFLESTLVTFHHIDREDIQYYVSNYSPLDKAGAYGIQDWSGVFVSSIEGDYHNVMGFPIARFHQHLKSADLLTELQG